MCQYLRYFNWRSQLGQNWHVRSFCGGSLKAEEEIYRHHWVLFPYDLAEFVSPWQGFQGGDRFFKRKCDVADRKVTEIGGMSARGQAGDQGLFGGEAVGRHVVTFSFPGAVDSKQ
jgi:hypothetical protein